MRKLTYLFKAVFSSKQEAKLRRLLAERTKQDEFKIIQQNTKFHNIHKNDRCFIIGNGPSIKQLDFSKLENEITFTVNQLPRNKEFRKLKTNYHLWADERFFHIDKDSPEDLELLEVMKSVNTSGNMPTVFYKTTAIEMVKSFKLDEMINIEYYMDGRMGNEEFSEFSIEYPMNRMLPVLPTCIQYAILIAVYMGFKEIYLLGCDCTGIINTINARIDASAGFEYGYEISENEKKRMIKVSAQTEIGDEMIWYGQLLHIYGYLFQYAQRHGCHLYNATGNTLIENIPRVDLEYVLKSTNTIDAEN